ncbi:hypothetical protein PIB30_058209 [Stylosanthes scabra]|uniref:Uncharacterized protein n=1 Tax=Stylosanthes scabra TaxID=79078 RepID=A0ABU6QJS6_9FABA|nr:hypothetical protein [Stylosanthes scabra]
MPELERGSRFNVLKEKDSVPVTNDEKRNDLIFKVSCNQATMQAGPSGVKAQLDPKSIVSIQKHIGADKSPQGGKKAPTSKTGSILAEKNFKPKSKPMEKAVEKSPLVNNDALPNQSHTSSSSRNPNMRAMEVAMLEKMRIMKKDQAATWEASRIHDTTLEDHAVKNPFLLLTPWYHHQQGECYPLIASGRYDLFSTSY